MAADRARRASADPIINVWTAEAARDVYVAPSESDDKYRRGVVGLATGSADYPGAAVLSSGAAARSGVGMVRYAGPDTVVDRVLNAYPEIVHGEGRCEAWVVGSGTPRKLEPRAARIIAKATPVVLDAGGIIWASPELRSRRQSPVIITPHAGELATLLQAYGKEISPTTIQADPATWARKAAELADVVVLLKGHVTHVAAPDGAIRAIDHAPSWLATAGSGDVLAGLLGGLIAMRAGQGTVDNDQLVRIGATAAWLHGEAAFRASRGGPILASDVVTALPEAIAQLVA